MKYKVPSRRSKPENVGRLWFNTPCEAAATSKVVTHVTTMTMISATISDTRPTTRTVKESITGSCATQY